MPSAESTVRTLGTMARHAPYLERYPQPVLNSQLRGLEKMLAGRGQGCGAECLSKVQRELQSAAFEGSDQGDTSNAEGTPEASCLKTSINLKMK